MSTSIPILLRPAADGDWDTVRALFRAYLEELDFGLDFQGVDAELQNLPGPYARPQGAVFLAMASPRTRASRPAATSIRQEATSRPHPSSDNGDSFRRTPGDAAGNAAERRTGTDPGRLSSTGLSADPGQVAGVVAVKPIDALPHDPDGARICEMKRLYVRPTHRGRGIGHWLALGIVYEARALGYTCMRLDTVASMSAARRIYRDLGFEEIEPYYDNPLDDVVYYERAL